MEAMVRALDNPPETFTHCVESLTPYRLPKRLGSGGPLPKTPTAKIRRRHPLGKIAHVDG